MRLTARLAALRARAKRADLAAEEGFTMIAAVGAVTLITVLAAAALAATNGDLHLVRHDLDHKRAHAAAQAGIADYSFHLNNDNDYWTKCTEVPEPNAVNQAGAEPLRKRRVSGSEGAEYAIELLPATTGPGEECDPSNPVETMLEQGGPETGSFRIRSTGYSGNAKVSIVASYKRASLLDYIYFTQLETSDPATYPASWQPGAYQQCTKFIREGRYDDPIPGSSGHYCTRIVFISGDEINGPLHTNDELQICGTPTFGRSPADVIEVSGPPEGWIGLNCSGYGSPEPDFVGPFVTTAPVLTPPPTNSRLKDIAEEEGYAFTGQTRITLNGEEIEVKEGSGPWETKPVPAGGVVYVENGGSCSSSYSPYARTDQMYPSTSGCGNAIVRGDYGGQLTIAAENDVIVDNDIERSGTGLLGLVANNFVRVYHPLYPYWRSTSRDPQDCNGTGNDDSGIYNGIGTPHNLRIDAAILAINHSFIVDHYNCGSSLGTLTVNGAISQKYRGAVGLTSGAGYVKNYNYDDRLRYQEPPKFLDPVESAWHIQRETLDFPE
jgi:hypothetical protein